MNDKYSKSDFDRFVEGMETRFDGFVEGGTDQELFLAGYLHGHFSLVVSEADLSADYSIEGLLKRMLESLSAAYKNNELTVADQSEADALLGKLWNAQKE